MVKVAGRDVLATWKVLISLIISPVLYSIYALLATIIAIKADAPTEWRIWTPLLVIMALPFIGYAALKFGEAGMDVLKSVLYVTPSHTLHKKCFLDHSGPLLSRSFLDSNAHSIN